MVRVAGRLIVAIAVLFVSVAYAEAANDALLKLLEVLRDRGSITAQEYETLRKAAEASDEATAAAREANPDLQPLVNKALAGKWYERLGLRGYTQFRFSDVLDENGPALEVPNDRSVNPNESFIIRRGRFVISGDPTEHLSLYAQMDFNASTGAADYSVQMRDLYADVWLDEAKLWRVRLGQSKVPYGFSNLQSSQNRAALERPDALNSAVEGERDILASLMVNTAASKQLFREVGNVNLKGAGDYGMLAVGLYSGQGLNRADQNGDLHVFGRFAYPFKAGDQLFELGVQGYHGRFVSATQALVVGNRTVTPIVDPNGVTDARAAATFVWYPQPLGVEAEWSAGRGPTLSQDLTTVAADGLQGGHLQVSYRTRNAAGSWLPFTRWSYYDGSRKFARNAPRVKVNEIDFGMEFARWAEVEVTGVYTFTLDRTRTSAYPYVQTQDAHRLGVQVQWNY